MKTLLNDLNLNFKNFENSVKTVLVLVIIICGVSALIYEILNPHTTF